MALIKSNGEIRIDVNEFSKAVKSQLKIYSDEVIDRQKKAVDDVTKEALVILKNNAPVQEKSTRKGKYKKSLKSKTDKETLVSKTNVLYSDGEASLTHLLENGHATVKKHGRYGQISRTKAIRHFGVANDYIESELPSKIEKSIK